MFGAPLPPATEARHRLGNVMSASGEAKGDAPWSLLDLTTPVRSQIFLNMVGDLLCYSGVNEVNIQVDTIRGVCRELCDQIDEECLTFNYDDTCSLPAGDRSDADEINLLNRAVRRHPRLKYFECLLHSKSKFNVLLQSLELPRGTWCSFVLEFKVSADQLLTLLQRFKVRRLNFVPEQAQDSPVVQESWKLSSHLPETQGLRMLCLRSCAEEIVKSLLAGCPRLQGLHIVDSRLSGDPGVQCDSLTSLSLTGVTSMPDEIFSQIIRGCVNLKSLYISKCHISNITIALPRLELLSLTHCRQLTDQCATEILQPCNTPSLRFLDLTENRGLVSPSIAHSNLEIAWLMHCPQLTDKAVSDLFMNCYSLSAANLVQSSIENAMISSHALRTLELATSQKLSDAAVSHLLQHCPCLTFLDVGHCCQLLEPRFVHASLETILLSFCVNLREQAIVELFANCPALRYVELAVCMFDMTRFQRECGANCQVIVNFDF